MFFNAEYSKIFFYICLDGVNIHAHIDKKYICGNYKPFLTEALSNTITQQTRFTNNSLEISTDELN